jgi:hypothetical protein
MAQAAREVEDPFLYERYVQALRRHGTSESEEPSPGHVVRYCHSCGMRAMFRLDAGGTWFECTHCGQYD